MADLGIVRRHSVQELQQALSSREMADYVRCCEAQFMRQTAELAYQVAWDPELRAIFIAGPSSSGKTTFNERLSSALHMHGRPTCNLSLDDYYRDALVPDWIDGRPDLESLGTLDVELMSEHIARLLEGETVDVPRFDFMTRRRVYEPGRQLRMPPRGILLVEGLHGLAPEVVQDLPRSSYRRILIMPYAQLVDEEQKELLGPREIRMLRRLCRDSRHRNTSPLVTLDYWPMLDYSEQTMLPLYIQEADDFVNSAMGYEFCVMPHLAEALIEQDLELHRQGQLGKPAFLPAGQDFAQLDLALAEAEKILKIARRLPSVDPEIVPPNSILNEFIH